MPLGIVARECPIQIHANPALLSDEKGLGSRLENYPGAGGAGFISAFLNLQRTHFSVA
jgi:hypothetical protein